jgi:hypothetical protein
MIHLTEEEMDMRYPHRFDFFDEEERKLIESYEA